MARRRLTGEGSIYQRVGDGRWVGVIDLGYVDGRRLRKTVTAKTKKELTPKFRQLKAELEAGASDERITVAQWMDKWLSDVAAEKNRASTLRTYRNYTEGWIVPHLGRYRLDRLRPDHLRGLYAAMKAAGRADSTRRQVHAIVRRALEVAVNDGLIVSNPAARVDAPAVGKGSHGKLTLTEAQTVLSLMDHESVRASRWIAALLAGLRQGEALGLTWDAVDLDRRVLVIRQAAQRIRGQGVQVVDLKSRAAYRMIPMVDPVWESLSREPSREGFVWGSERPADPRRDWQGWVDLLKLAEVPHRPLHAARATTGSLLMEAGVPEKIIAEILGHSQVKITQDHYLHGDDRMHREGMGRLTGLVGAVPLRAVADLPSTDTNMGDR